MSAPLYRLVYRSRPVIEGCQDELRRQLGAILRASRRRNPELEITGALMLRDGCFIQALEGPMAAVEAVFERICRDERHGAVTLLELTPIDRRGFGDWAMAWIDEADEQAAAARHGGIGPLAPTAAEAAAIIAAMRSALADGETRQQAGPPTA